MADALGEDNAAAVDELRDVVRPWDTLQDRLVSTPWFGAITHG